MMVVIAVFLILIFITLLAGGFLAFLAWQKVSIFLTWNTRYESASYEQAITTSKVKHAPVSPSRTENRGRAIVQTDDLVDLSDAPFESVVQAIESVGK